METIDVIKNQEPMSEVQGKNDDKSGLSQQKDKNLKDDKECKQNHPEFKPHTDHDDGQPEKILKVLKTTDYDIDNNDNKSNGSNDKSDEGNDNNQDIDETTIATAADCNDDDDDGDPIPSGTGVVSRDCSVSDLVGWSEILPKWHSKLNSRPKSLEPLVRCGIPEPLRGEVWQLLSGAHQSLDLMERYRIFLVQSAPSEQIILRDVHRTYPAHENFRSDATGSSSLLDSLFKVCKAYAVYDEEIGYCQGLSFLVAALLLHMPEEQAFCVFVRIMQHYNLRDLFRNNFDELYLKFYQLERLLEDHIPDLYQHFTKIGIEPFTYASQWFLTVFTAKFPLNAVFYIMDIFLLDGMNTIFQIALALLGSSRQELLCLDFEGVLKYFRVQMPKRYRSQENVQQLIAASSEFNLKKLNKYAKQYGTIKQKEKLLENPISRLQRENAKLTENNLRLEQENDDLARDLVASKIQLRAQMDVLEEKIETLNRDLVQSQHDCQTHMNTISDVEDEKVRLEVEVTQLKEVCRRELQRAENESARDFSIISNYKKICTEMSNRLEDKMRQIERFIELVEITLNSNGSCKDNKCLGLFQSYAGEFLEQLRKVPREDNGSGKATKQLDSSTGGLPTASREIAESLSSNSTDSNPPAKPIGALLKSNLSNSNNSDEAKIKLLTEHVDELEIELARTKLALVEAECKCQQLSHDLNTGITVKTASKSQTGLAGTNFGGRLDFVKAAVSTNRSPSAASSAFAKINTLISEKISNISSASSGGHQSIQSPAESTKGTSLSSEFIVSEAKRKMTQSSKLQNGGDKQLNNNYSNNNNEKALDNQC